MNKLSIILILTLVSLSSFAQVKKPTLMVIPADNWCKTNDFMDKVENQRTTLEVPNYKRVLQNSSDCNNVITKINALMSDRNFPLKDLSAVLKSTDYNSAIDAMTSTKSGFDLAESPTDILRRNANVDIMIELNWQVNVMGPKRSITYSLAAKDSYTDKQIAGVQGTGSPSVAAELPILLEEAVIGNMDNFCNQLLSHFSDMMENGREVVLEARIVNNDSGIDLYSKYGEDELTDIIDDWISNNTVGHRYNLSSGSEYFLKFEQVRIPLYQANGRPNDTRRWARELARELTTKYQIPCKVDIRGLGKAIIVIGED